MSDADKLLRRVLDEGLTSDVRAAIEKHFAVPDLSIGDAVWHKKRGFEGVGHVVEISKSGKRVRVEYFVRAVWGHDSVYRAYFDPAMLEKVPSDE